jgi:hypothetical protein
LLPLDSALMLVCVPPPEILSICGCLAILFLTQFLIFICLTTFFVQTTIQCKHFHLFLADSNIWSPVEIVLSSTVMPLSALLALISKIKSLLHITLIHQWLIYFFEHPLGSSCHTHELYTILWFITPYSQIVYYCTYPSTQTIFSFMSSNKSLNCFTNKNYS